MTEIWRRSSHSSSGTSGECVELAATRTGIGIRDSKSPEAGHLTVSRAELSRLIGLAKSGELER